MSTITERAPATAAGNLELIKAFRKQIQEGSKLAREEAAKQRVPKPPNKEAKERYRKAQLEKARKAHAANPAIRMLKTAQTRALAQGVPFDLTLDDIVVPDVCPILGIPLRVSEGCGPSQNSPSLDKIRPELGYVKGNVQVISHKANAMKNDATPKDMLAFAYWCTTQFGMHGRA